MFNGEITHMMLNSGSVIYDNVMSVGPVNDRIDVIFFSILSRKPNDEEEELALQEIRSSGAAGYGNVIWALVNTKNFCSFSSWKFLAAFSFAQTERITMLRHLHRQSPESRRSFIEHLARMAFGVSVIPVAEVGFGNRVAAASG